MFPKEVGGLGVYWIHLTQKRVLFLRIQWKLRNLLSEGILAYIPYFNIQCNNFITLFHAEYRFRKPLV